MMQHNIALETTFGPAAANTGALKPTTPTTEHRTIWRRWFDVLVTNQEWRARRVTAPYLARQSDATLNDIGFNADQITAIRREAGDRTPIGL
jgi:uncharacterized protein YjiS (DUF1127 family)